ncbi:MAG TPA: P-loop NTPase fold protein [Anaerolineae bacterium]|nr:P-loop NTPase fold protein [Anaerolineae bacterium]
MDLLRHQDLAGILGTRLRRIHNEHPQNSFLIHVDGPWGSGKSTLLGFLGRQLDSFWIEEEREDETQDEGRDTPGSSENAAGSGAHRRAANGEAREADWMVLWFDAWRQSGIGPPWWTLLASLREQMDWRLGLKDRIFLRIRETVFKIGLAGSSYLLAVIIMFLVLAVGLMLIDLEQVNADWLTDTAKAISAVFAALVILWTGARVASKFLLWDSAKGAVIFEQSTRDPMRIAAEHFSWLLGKVGKPVVFFIDDLDRCDEGNVVALLEAIQTLIRDVNLKQTRVKEGRGKPSPGHDGQQPNYGPHFVVAADGAWIRRSFAKNFQSFEGAVDEPGRPLGFLFLDKLFQLTVPMPYLSHELQQSYFDGLLGVQGEGAGADPDTEMGDIDEQVAAALEQVAVGSNDAEVMAVFEKAPIRVKQRIAGPVVRRLTDQEVETAREHELQKFAGLLDPNPRSMKRFLNAYSIMLSLQPLQLNPVSIDTLALWTILRLRWPVLADYLAEHPDSVSDVGNKEADLSGVPEHLHDLYRDAGLKKLVTFEQGGPLTPGAIESIR